MVAVRLLAGTRKVRRAIYFAAAPVVGSWRYHNRFQIVPPPPQAPRPPAEMGDHPLILEVAYMHSSDFMISNERAGGEIGLVLAGLLPWVDDRSRVAIHQEWGIPMDGSALPTRSIWTQATYMFEGFDSIADDFSAPACDALALVEDDDITVALAGRAVKSSHCPPRSTF
jgi:hypothetical protein